MLGILASHMYLIYLYSLSDKLGWKLKKIKDIGIDTYLMTQMTLVDVLPLIEKQTKR